MPHAPLPLPPDPHTADQREAFRKLQARLPELLLKTRGDPKAPAVIVVVPSLSVDAEILSKITGVHHYEERLLCMLLLLRLPRTRVVYVTSQPVADAIIDYYLHLLPGIPAQHVRERLTLLSCHDASPTPLSAKILGRRRVIERIRSTIGDPASAYMACYNVSELERRLSVRLGIPLYGCDPDLLHLGSKSGGRRILREAGLPVAEGFEDLTGERELAEALAELKAREPGLRRAVVKLNDGFSGEGNAVFDFRSMAGESVSSAAVRPRLHELAFEANGMTWETFAAKIADMGAVAEAFIEGAEKRSPSAQYRIDPLGQIERLSTHDQVLGGPSDQIFHGCLFPADPAYRLELQAEGLKAAEALRDKGVLGRFGVDFVSVPEAGRWRHYAVEFNLRKGGTTHPYLMLQFLTDGRYDPETGLFHAPNGQPCYYFASDNLESPIYRGLMPEDLIDIAVMNDLHFYGASQEGVAFHLIGALSEFGKLGITCVAGTPERAKRLYDDAVAILDREAAASR